MKGLRLVCIAVGLVAFGTALPAQANVVFTGTDVTIDFSLISPGLPIVKGVHEVVFTGRAAINGRDVDGSGTISVGDRSRLVGGDVIATFLNSSGGIIPVPGLNSTFEATLVLRNWDSTTIAVAAGPPITITETLDAGSVTGGTGLLDVRVDLSPDFVKTDAATWTDGTLAATFFIQEGGSVFRPDIFDGTLDATLDLDSQVAGFITSESPGVPFNAIVSSSTADLDSDGNGLPDTPTPANLLAQFPTFTPFEGNAYSNSPPGAGLPFDNVADDDGSAQFGNKTQAPEPGSLLILGSGLVGLAGYGSLRRRQR